MYFALIIALTAINLQPYKTQIKFTQLKYIISRLHMESNPTETLAWQLVSLALRWCLTTNHTRLNDIQKEGKGHCTVETVTEWRWTHQSLGRAGQQDRSDWTLHHQSHHDMVCTVITQLSTSHALFTHSTQYIMHTKLSDSMTQSSMCQAYAIQPENWSIQLARLLQGCALDVYQHLANSSFDLPCTGTKFVETFHAVRRRVP